MSLTRFSVIVPLYNKVAYVRRCLDSIAAQTHDDFEVIVVNDGSTDGGAEIVRSYGDSRFRLVEQENGGVSAARNLGIRCAREAWIAFLDADDEYTPHFLGSAAAQIAKHPSAGIVFGKALFTNSATYELPLPGGEEAVLIDDYFESVVWGRGPEVNTSCVAVSKDALDRAGGFPVGVRVGEDSDLWFRLACVTKALFIPEYLAVYHREASNSGWQEQAASDAKAYWTLTYQSWKRNQLIPASLARSADAYYQRHLLEKSLYYAVNGARLRALRGLRDVDYKAAPKKYALKVLLYSLLPLAAIRRILRSSD